MPDTFDTSKLVPLDVSGLVPLKEEPKLDLGGLVPLNTAGLVPVEATAPVAPAPVSTATTAAPRAGFGSFVDSAQRSYYEHGVNNYIKEKFDNAAYLNRLRAGGKVEPMEDGAFSAEQQKAFYDLSMAGKSGSSPEARAAEIARVERRVLELNDIIKAEEAKRVGVGPESAQSISLGQALEKANQMPTVGGRIGSSFGALIDNAGGIPDMVAGGAYGTARPIAGALATALVTRGSGLVARVLPEIVSGAITLNDSQVGIVGELMQKMAQKRGFDIRKNPEMMDALMNDVDFVEDVRQEALRGGTSDAIWTAISTRLGLSPKIKGVWQPIVQAGAESATTASQGLFRTGEVDVAQTVAAFPAGFAIEGPSFAIGRGIDAIKANVASRGSTAPATPAAQPAAAPAPAPAAPVAAPAQPGVDPTTLAGEVPAPAAPAAEAPAPATPAADPLQLEVERRQLESDFIAASDAHLAAFQRLSAIIDELGVDHPDAIAAKQEMDAAGSALEAARVALEAKTAEVQAANVAADAARNTPPAPQAAPSAPPATQAVVAQGSVPPRPIYDDRFSGKGQAGLNDFVAAVKEWDEKYGKTHLFDGTPKEAQAQAQVAPAVPAAPAAPAPTTATATPAAPAPADGANLRNSAENTAPQSTQAPAAPAASYDGGDPRNDPRFADLDRDDKSELRRAFSTLQKLQERRAEAAANGNPTNRLDDQIARLKANIGETLGDGKPAPQQQAQPAQPAPAPAAPVAPQAAEVTPTPSPQAQTAPAPASDTQTAQQEAPAQPAPTQTPVQKPSFVAGLREDARKLRGEGIPQTPPAKPLPPRPEAAVPVDPNDPQTDPRFKNLNRNQREQVNVAQNKINNDLKTRAQAVRDGRSTKNLDDRIAKNRAEVERVLSGAPKPPKQAKPANAPVDPSATPIDPTAPEEQSATSEDDPEVQAAKFPNPNPDLDNPIKNDLADFNEQRAAELEKTAQETDDPDLKDKFQREAKALRNRAEAMRRADNEQAVRDSQGQARPINRDDDGNPQANRPDDEEDDGSGRAEYSPRRKETPLEDLVKTDIMRGGRPAYRDAKGPKAKPETVFELLQNGLAQQKPVNPNIAYNLAEGKYAPLKVKVEGNGLTLRIGNMTESYSVDNQSRDGWRGIIEDIRKRHEGKYDTVVIESVAGSKPAAKPLTQADTQADTKAQGEIDDDLAEFMDQGGESWKANKTAGEVLQKIVDLNGRLAPIAKVLLALGDKVSLSRRVTTGDVDGGRWTPLKKLGINGEQFPDDGDPFKYGEEIFIGGQGSSFGGKNFSYVEDTAIEEILHALTASKYPKDLRTQLGEKLNRKARGNIDVSKSRAEIEIAVAREYAKNGSNKEWRDLCRAYVAFVDKRVDSKKFKPGDPFPSGINYRASNLAEFMVGALSEKEVQDILAGIKDPDQKQSLLQTFINAVKQVFGFTDAQMKSMLGTAVSSIEKITSSERTLKEGEGMYGPLDADEAEEVAKGEYAPGKPANEADPENYFKKTKPGQKLGSDGLPIRDQTGLPSYLEVGHKGWKGRLIGAGREGSILWGRYDGGAIESKNSKLNKDGRSQVNHGEWFGDADQQGRMEPPVVKDGKITEKGRISIITILGADATKEEVRQAREYAAKEFSKRLRIEVKPSDFDVFEYGMDKDARAAKYGISRDDTGPVLRSPSPQSRLQAQTEGKGVVTPDGDVANHTDANLAKRGFVSAISDEKLSDKDRGSLSMDFEFVDEQYFKGYVGRIRRKGKEVGRIEVEYDERKSVARIGESHVDDGERNKGYGTILYAEAGERLRRMGATKLTGDLANSESVPLIIREKVFGDGSTKVTYKGDEMSVGDFRGINPDNVDWGGLFGPTIETEVPQLTPTAQKLAQEIKTAAKGNPETAAARIKAALDKWEAEVLGKPGENRLFSPGPDTIAAMAYRLSKDAAAHAAGFAKWAAQAVKDFGQKIKPFLKDIWAKSQKMRQAGADIVTFRYLSSRADKMWQNASRNPQSKTLRDLANLIFTKQGPDADAAQNDIPTRIQTVRTQFNNAYANILKPFADDFAKMSKQQLQEWDAKFRRAVIGIDPMPDGKLGEAVQKFRKLSSQLLAYQRNAGMDIGDAGEGYFPRSYGADAVAENTPAFVEAAAKAYEMRNERLRNQALQDLERNAAARAEMLKQRDKDAGRQVKTDAEYQAIVDEWYAEQQDKINAEFDKTTEDFKKMASDWAFRIQNGKVDELSLYEGGALEATMPDHADPRTFTDAEAALLDQFLDKDMDKLMARYIASAVKKTEAARAFGAKGEKFGQMMSALQSENVDAGTIEETADLIRRSLDIGTDRPTGLMAKVIDWSNAIISAGYLGFSFVNNVLLEPVSFGIRTGNAYLALKGVAETWKAFTQELVNSPGLQRGIKRAYGTKLEFARSVNKAISEDLGLLHNEIERTHLGSHWDYGSETEGSPVARWLTQRVQMGNLMAQTERAKIQASVAIARLAVRNNVRFYLGEAPLQKLLAKAGLNAKADASSKSMLQEIGVPAEDHDSFAKFVMSLDGMSDAEYQQAVYGDSREAALYRQAIQRMSVGLSIKTNPALKMARADRVEGRFMMQLMNYSYAYANLVKDRMYDSALKAANPKAKISAMDRLRYAAPLMVGAPLAIIASEAGKQLVGALWPSDGTDDRDELEDWQKIFDSSSYAGMFGKKVEYLTKILLRDQIPVGVVPEAGAKALGASFKSLAGKDSDAMDKRAAKQAYQVGVKPGVMMGASAVHPFFGFLANQALRQRDTRDAFVEGMAGE